MLPSRRGAYLSVPCAVCGTPVTRPAWWRRWHTQAACSEPCLNTLRRHTRPRSDRRVAQREGVVLIRVGHDHPLADNRGFALEHRLVLSAKLGRWLTRQERVAWIDGDRRNNVPENLVLVSAPRDEAAAELR